MNMASTRDMLGAFPIGPVFGDDLLPLDPVEAMRRGSAHRVPLIVGKNDMQGYGSAVTYARRYGLMSMAGIAPEDDDGNAAGVHKAHLPKVEHAADRQIQIDLVAHNAHRILCAVVVDLALERDGQTFIL